MLKRLGPSAVPAGQTTSAALFPSKLEFNPPAHGTWNIVHLGMLVPEAHQIYVCAVNCMRGVVLTAAEMGAQERFSCVVLKEEDIVKGRVEAVTREGIAEALRSLPKLPPCVIVFPVCTHHFLGVDMARVYRALEAAFPTVDFVRAFMDPVSRKRLSPDMRLRKVMYDPLPECEPDEGRVLHLGCDFPQAADSDLRRLLAVGGLALDEPQDCRSYAEFKALSKAGTILCTYPNGRYGAEAAARRLGRRFLYLPMSFSYAEIESQQRELCAALSLPLPDFQSEAALCDQALSDALSVIGDTPVVLDAAAHPRPLGLARLLIEHGFRVTEVYLDAVGEGEEDDLSRLREKAPSLALSSVILPEMRVAERTRKEKTLAIGQKAAWFTGTAHFVNIVEGGGLWGFSGIQAMARLMAEAFLEEKDARDLIPHKGWGCVSCI